MNYLPQQAVNITLGTQPTYPEKTKPKTFEIDILKFNSIDDISL